MNAISKQLFYEKVSSGVKCRNIHSWNQNCTKSQIWFVSTVFVGSLKFFLPIYIVKAIINSRRFKEKNFWLQLVLGQIRSSIYGTLMGSLFLAGNCLLCNLTGRLHYYNVSIVAGMFSGLSLLVETKENQTLDTLIFFNLLVEAFFRNFVNFNLPILTTGQETLLFMAVSSLLMFLLQSDQTKKKLTNFWFYTPPKFSRKENLDHNCVHEGFCADFALQGIQKYFLLGYGFGVVRKLIPSMLRVIRNPLALLPIAFNKDNVKFGAFISAYVGVHRYFTCLLLKSNGVDQKYFGALAGLLAGATYSISPNLQVLTVGITTVLQILYHRLLKKLQVKNRLLPQQLVYMLSHCLLLHNVMMCKETCPTYYVNMLNNATNNLFPQVYDEVIGKYFPS
ncbi:transmembrane protein 135 [Dendroctonus ponderosae]|uniref:Transmembrane protein 135 N-terminal domain-containing protein n=1 Tax=Dendroctonus ponderosae TaxID=77166 RepID=A0AAR5QHL4_DENPD|nr:transmembrane protein 135 [Dendroctonus ponderosae]